MLKELVFAETIMFYSQVGPAVLNKPKAILDMTEIAGSEDRFFKISNYESLKNILSSLEKSIIGIEGTVNLLQYAIAWVG